MKKRVVAVVLWFYTGWYAGAFIATILGVSPVIGPIIGATAAALIGLDPRGIIWPRSSAPAVSAPMPEVEPTPA